ncbi:LOW QUALITY PROTEIN: hypothetical protein U9M48_024058, partial [Paspalum notatum var. saurae]
MEAAFRCRKSFATQNVMAAVDFDLKFTYVLAGWEGTAHDAVVLADALERVNGLRVPEGIFYLVDVGYGAKPGFMPPFHGVWYHLNEWGSNPVQNCSILDTPLYRAFGSLKRRFKILDDATPFFPFPTQVDIVIACSILHNWVLSHGADRFIIPENKWTPNPRRTAREQANDHRLMVEKRQMIAERMWADRQNHLNLTMDLDQHHAMSTFVLKFLADLVASGTKTSTRFKQVHLNSCARALFENLGVQRTGTQIANHLRKWKRIYEKVEKLKNMSAALWDEQNCMISLDPEHYNNHIKARFSFDHCEDANYLNTPIEHYHEMATIFGNSLATGAYAKGANDPLGSEMIEMDIAPKNASSEPTELHDADGGTQPFNNGAESPPSKKQKLTTEEELIVMISKSLGEVSAAINKLAEPELAVPKGLYEELKSIPGFDEAYLDHYYAYLCDNPP